MSKNLKSDRWGEGQPFVVIDLNFFFKHQKNPPGIVLRNSHLSCQQPLLQAAAWRSLWFFDSGMSTWSQQIEHPYSWNGMMLHKLKNYSSYTWFFVFKKSLFNPQFSTTNSRQPMIKTSGPIPNMPPMDLQKGDVPGQLSFGKGWSFTSIKLSNQKHNTAVDRIKIRNQKQELEFDTVVHLLYSLVRCSWFQKKTRNFLWKNRQNTLKENPVWRKNPSSNDTSLTQRELLGAPRQSLRSPELGAAVRQPGWNQLEIRFSNMDLKWILTDFRHAIKTSATSGSLPSGSDAMLSKEEKNVTTLDASLLPI